LGFDGYGLVTSLVPNRCGKFARNIEDDEEDSSDNTNSGKTVMVHQGWAITWAKSDTATLTPKLPTLTSEMRVPEWTPGQKIRDGEYDRYPSYSIDTEELLGHDFYWFLAVGLPVLGALSIGLCIWCCVRKCKKERQPNLVYVITQ
jgi:hypothetical protein